MSVNVMRQFAPYHSLLREQSNYRQYPPAQHVFLDSPIQVPLQTFIDHRYPSGSYYRWQQPRIINNFAPPTYQHHQPVRRAEHSSDEDNMFDRYAPDFDNMYPLSKHNDALPVCTQAAPNTYSFRPWRPEEQDYSATVQTEQMPMMKVESIPDLPTPAVLSKDVDVSKYEVVQHREWLDAPADYLGFSPASEDNFESSPRSDDVDAFTNHTTDYSLNTWLGGYETQTAQDRSVDPSSTDGSSSASPALSYDNFNDHTTGLTWTPSMFGFPDVVPPTRFSGSNNTYQPTTAIPRDVERLSMQRQDRVLSMVPTMQSSDLTEEDPSHVNRRDKLLMDMRSKGHSYKEIKRLGHFKEAESTLRGRLRTLTKEKSERVRRPKWSTYDVELLHEAVAHFVSPSSKTSRTKKRKPARKLPWKKISQWMKDHGSSYLFAPATCAKKWVEQ